MRTFPRSRPELVIKNPPHLRIPPVIKSDFELRGGLLSGRRRRKIVRIFSSRNGWKSFRNAFKKHSKPLKITVFYCILKPKIPKFSRLRRAIPTVATNHTVLLTHHTNSFLKSKFLYLQKLRNASARLSNVLRMVNARSYARKN